MKVPTAADQGREVEVIRLEAKEVADISAEGWSVDGFRHVPMITRKVCLVAKDVRLL